MADIDLSQLNQLIVDMTAAPQKAQQSVRLAVQKTAADIKRDAQMMAPVDTGNLRASIGYETKATADSVEAEIGPTASYGIYVEMGTVNMAPHAYMGPAFDRHAGNLDDALGQILDGLI